MNKNTWIIVGAIAVVAILIGISGLFGVKEPGELIDVQAQTAPDFTLTSLEGGSVSLSSYVGVKPVVLDFFATWCPNCRRAMPVLSEWHKENKDTVEVIGINLQEKEEKVREFIESKNIAFPILLDPQAVVSGLYGVQYTNFHVLINTDGTVFGVVPGDVGEETLVQFMQHNAILSEEGVSA